MLTDFKIARIEKRGFETYVLFNIFVGEMRKMMVRALPTDRNLTEVSVYVRTELVAKKEVIFRNPDTPIEDIRKAGNALLAEDKVNTPVSEEQIYTDYPEAKIRCVDTLLMQDKRVVESRILFNDQEARP